MSVIKLNCVDQVLAFTNTPIIASGGVGEDFIEFTFCSQWDGYEKTAVFFKDADVFLELIDGATGRCTIPYDVLAESGKFRVGVFGVNAAMLTRTSVYAEYTVLEGAVAAVEVSAEPGILEQVLAAAASKQDPLIWDPVPAEDSDNAINSGAVFAALQHYTPAGSGLGALSVYDCADDAEIDAVLLAQINEMPNQSFKRVVLRFTTLNNATATACAWYADIYKLGANYALITLKSYVWEGHTIQREWLEGVMKPWQWDNPPMHVGVEYRTTERFNGKPVYKKLVSFINDSDITAETTSLNIPHGIADLSLIIGVKATTSGYLLPYISPSSTLCLSAWNVDDLVMNCGQTTWGAGRTWYFLVEYTKTTD